MSRIWRNAKLGLGLFSKRPGFTIVAVLSLVLAVGAHSSILSLVDSALLNPLNSADAVGAANPDATSQAAAPAGPQIRYAELKPESASIAIPGPKTAHRSRIRVVGHPIAPVQRPATTNSSAVAQGSPNASQLRTRNLTAASEALATLGNETSQSRERAELGRELIEQVKQYYSGSLASHLAGVEALKSVPKSVSAHFNVRGSR
ncbi:MAG TPA: hypothetical protein VI756_01020 [Blastocatellia bacterium]